MKNAENNICPRCLGAVPTEAAKGEYPGALSRVADVEICSLCGQDEAVGGMFSNENALIPQDQWPLSREDVERRTAPFQILN